MCCEISLNFWAYVIIYGSGEMKDWKLEYGGILEKLLKFIQKLNVMWG